MAPRRKTKVARRRDSGSDQISLEEALVWLEKRGTKKNIQDLDRYGISASHAFGVTVGDTKKFSKQVGKSHALALELWASGWYEARLLAGFVDEPEKVTVQQMNQWADDFDNWAIVDSVCFHLFDQTKHAWKRLGPWSKAKGEFKKRAAFALLWSLSVHDKEASDKASSRKEPLTNAISSRKPSTWRSARSERGMLP